MNRITLISALLFLIVFSVKVFCGETAVTDVKKLDTSGRAVYEITVNNCVLIKEIEVIEQGGQKIVKYPEYITQKGKAYPQVIFLTKQSKEAVRKAVLGGAAGKSSKQSTRFEITRFSKFKKQSGLKALCAVTLNGALEVECKIISGKNGPWVSWPSKKSAASGQWVQQVVITDNKLRENIEKELLAKYEIIAKSQ